MYGNLNPLTELRQSAAALSRLTLCAAKAAELVWHGAGEGISPLCDLIGVVPCRTDIEVEPSIVRRGFGNNSKTQYGRLHSSSEYAMHIRNEFMCSF
jgi:hypothetical protein